MAGPGERIGISDKMDVVRLNGRKDGAIMKRRDFVKMTLAGAAARDIIASRGILVANPTGTESEMVVHEAASGTL
jgi:hypothetical protein